KTGELEDIQQLLLGKNGELEDIQQLLKSKTDELQCSQEHAQLLQQALERLQSSASPLQEDPQAHTSELCALEEELQRTKAKFQGEHVAVQQALSALLLSLQDHHQQHALLYNQVASPAPLEQCVSDALSAQPLPGFDGPDAPASP